MVRVLHLFAIALLVSQPALAAKPTVDRPNFVLIVCDNLGYGDVACFGPTEHRTPRLDQMAAEGLQLTGFYSTSGVCTPSRSSIMTGCYPRRVNLHISDLGRSVLSPVSQKGLHPDEVTIAEVLKEQGYATTIIGKWHLGDQPPFLPTRQGFDSYFGIPYSDDMTATEDGTRPPLPLMQDEQVLEAPTDRNLLTRRYTEKAIEYMTEHQDEPFFLYLPHAMPGSTRAPYADEPFRGKSANGAWGDSVEELDWSTGEILDAIERLGLDEKTLVIWTSDNGAPRRDPPQGSNLPMGGWGYTTAEGGQRIPCIARWPGQIAPGQVSGTLTTMMDLLPTFAEMAGATVPNDRTIDGHDITRLLLEDPKAKSPYDAFYYYYMGQLQAVRSGPWKLYLPVVPLRKMAKSDGTLPPVRLYDVVKDPGETTDLADKHANVIKRLTRYAERARQDLGDLDREGSGQREVGWQDDPTPQLLPSR